MLVGLRLGSAAAILGILLAPPPSRAEIRFEDVTAPAQIDRKGPSYGASWGDFDADGWPDLWVGNHYTTPNLYRNLGDGRFEDVAPEVWPRVFRDTHGAAWGDFDNDGDQDLVEVVGGNNGNFLYVNEGGLLIDRAEALGVALPGARSRTPLWVDWDRDGRLDLVLLHEARSDGLLPSAFLRNFGDRFEDLTQISGFNPISSHYGQLADVFGTRTPELLTQGPVFPLRVYRGGVLPFEDVRPLLSMPAQGGSSAMDVAIVDFDGDLASDLFIAKQAVNRELFQPNETELWIRLSTVRTATTVRFRATDRIQVQVYPEFPTSPTALLRIGLSASSSASYFFALDPADPSTHGLAPFEPGRDQGLYLGFDPPTQTWTITHTTPGVEVANLVVRSDAPLLEPEAINFEADPPRPWPNFYAAVAGGFAERRSQAGFGFGMPCSSVGPADFDNDGDIDLYLACTNPVSNLPNLLFENLGDGSFARVADAGGAEGSLTGRSESVALADFDRDGFVDVFLTNGEGGAPFNGGPQQLFRNLGNGNHWIELDLVGRFSNRDGIGSRVALESGGRLQIRIQDGGMHRRAQHHQRIHFGLGASDRAERLRIDWPSGVNQELFDLDADRVWTVVETSGTACGDGIDNDLDGWVDHPDDPDCEGWWGRTESPGCGGGFGLALALPALVWCCGSRRRREGRSPPPERAPRLRNLRGKRCEETFSGSWRATSRTHSPSGRPSRS